MTSDIFKVRVLVKSEVSRSPRNRTGSTETFGKTPACLWNREHFPPFTRANGKFSCRLKLGDEDINRLRAFSDHQTTPPLSQPAFEDRFTCPLNHLRLLSSYPTILIFDMPNLDYILSDDEPQDFEPPGTAENLSQPLEVPVGEKEGRSLNQLLYLIRTYAPHLRSSFICSEPWWERHWGLPEAHVSSTNRPVMFVNPVLTFP